MTTAFFKNILRSKVKHGVLCKSSCHVMALSVHKQQLPTHQVQYDKRPHAKDAPYQRESSTAFVANPPWAHHSILRLGLICPPLAACALARPLGTGPGGPEHDPRSHSITLMLPALPVSRVMLTHPNPGPENGWGHPLRGRGDPPLSTTQVHGAPMSLKPTAFEARHFPKQDDTSSLTFVIGGRGPLRARIIIPAKI